MRLAFISLVKQLREGRWSVCLTCQLQDLENAASQCLGKEKGAQALGRLFWLLAHAWGCLQTVGATVPSNGIVVEERPVMGVKSQGMLCSAFNIGWLDSEAGVLVELPEDSFLGEAAPENPPEVGLLCSLHSL